MPNTREKLIELITDRENDLIRKIVWFTDTYRIKEVADHLIANGVTVQEWISVKDMLPEPFVSVLACIPSESPLPTVHESYIADHGAWVCILTAERYKPGEVTHWMPLPEPPKEV